MLESIPYQNSVGFPILSCLVFIPVLGAIALLFFNPEKVTRIRHFTFGVTVVNFLFSLLLIAGFKTGTPNMQFVERFRWIPSIGAEYHLGIDGISLLLVLLTTLLSAISVLSTFKAITDKVKEFMISMLILETAMLGVFCALDVLLFYLFWELQLVPMYLIIGIWGSHRRIYSAMKFFIYTAVGSFPMVLGLLGVYFNYHDYAVAHNLAQPYSFNYLQLLEAPLSLSSQKWIFWALFVGFAIKIPMFPFHTWLPDAHSDAPTAGSVILAGVLLKMGTYGFVRFLLPWVPQAIQMYLPLLVVLSFIAILYTAWVCLNQDDMKRLIAYSSVSHMGFITLGTFVMNWNGIAGGVMQMINHGVSTGAMFLLIGLIYERRHTRQIDEYGGLFKVLPIYTTFFTIVLLSSMGVPGMNGFVGEILVLMGAYQMRGLYALLLAVGVLCGAAYLLWMYQRVFLGEVTNPKNKGLADLDKREVATLAPLIFLIFFIGLYPTPFLKVIEPSVNYILDHTQTPGAKLVAQAPSSLKMRSQRGFNNNTTYTVGVGADLRVRPRLADSYSIQGRTETSAPTPFSFLNCVGRE